MLTLNRMRRLEAALRRQGYGPTIEWSENIQPPADADGFADQAIYAIINGGMKATVAGPIHIRCMASLQASLSATSVFGHPGKAMAIDQVWSERQRLFDGYREARDPLVFLVTLPWIGPVLALHLAKLMGHDVAKPDIHLERLARRDCTTTAKLCRKLARQTGYRVATIDSILWRACADGLIKSQVNECDGWSAAISAEVSREAWLPKSGEPTPRPGLATEPDTSAQA